MFEYGDIVKDKVTKIEGIITGHADYVTGCDQWLVQPTNEKKDTRPDIIWFDENRIEKIGEDTDTKNIVKERLGADASAPMK